MTKPDFTIDIFLQPGEFFFGDRETRIRTILGSCVSVTFWHPKLLLGGMCHIMLPGRQVDCKVSELNGKYADEAISLLMQEMKNAGTSPHDYQVKIFGGSDMFSRGNKEKSNLLIGDKNLLAVTRLLNNHGFGIHAKHVGGKEHRYIVFDVWSGYVWMKHQTFGQQARMKSNGLQQAA